LSPSAFGYSTRIEKHEAPAVLAVEDARERASVAGELKPVSRRAPLPARRRVRAFRSVERPALVRERASESTKACAVFSVAAQART